MNILIVEDESQIRSTLHDSLQRIGFTDIWMAHDGTQALEMIKSRKFDLILSDIRMPGMDGIALLETVRREYSDILFIVLSGYDLFEYAQKAIRHSAFSYLLKPLSDEDLETVMREALRVLNLKRELFEDELKIKIKLKQGTTALRRQLLTEALNGHADESQLARKCQEYDLEFTHPHYCVWLAGIDNLDELALAMSNPDLELLKYGLENMCSEVFRERGFTAEPFKWEEGGGFLLNSGSLDEKGGFPDIVGQSLALRQMAHTYLKLDIAAAIGSVECSLPAAGNSFDTARRAYAQTIAEPHVDGVYAYRPEEPIQPLLLALDLKLEQELLAVFDSCQFEAGMQFIADRYRIFAKPCSFEIKDVQQLNYHLLILIHKIMSQLGFDPEAVMGEEYYLYTKVNRLKSIAAIIEWFQTLLQSCFDYISERSTRSTKKLVDKAKEFMSAHFHEEIGLELVSEQLHISPEYLSREFKKESGENFIDFLLRLRINKAKEYMRQGNYKTYEIARLVGYHDEKYFSKVFKKTTGFTPSEYRFRNT
ncbi:response regulator [Cohnella sp. LGH]|uniref:response regulator n=1 Tax=Cohnella sp. LGH TaxID=1619153 RepID=UPI001ADB505C|nr:response regulator [Cohnella sp. LGH]QTH45685.1 response regulator [Cohnella sp. LGH]